MENNKEKDIAGKKSIDIEKMANEMVELINNSRKRGAIGINSHIRIIEIMNILDNESFMDLLKLMIENESLDQKDRAELKKLL